MLLGDRKAKATRSVEDIVLLSRYFHRQAGALEEGNVLKAEFVILTERAWILAWCAGMPEPTLDRLLAELKAIEAAKKGLN